MEHAEIVTRLTEMVRAEGSQDKVAVKLGISQPYLSDILRGRRTPGPRVLKALGLVKESIYKEAT